MHASHGEIIGWALFYLVFVALPCALTVKYRGRKVAWVATWIVFGSVSVFGACPFGTIWIFLAWIALYRISFHSSIPMKFVQGRY